MGFIKLDSSYFFLKLELF